MDSKLTLRLSAQVIKQAKRYAGTHNTSISRLVENYLQLLAADASTREEVSPLVHSLTGVIAEPDGDYKDGYGDYLHNKHR
jgi:hypothetical protein